MMNAIIIHGTTDKEEYYSDEYPSLSNSHWIPWLQKQLLMRNIDCQTPEMPSPIEFQYDYSEWKTMLERFTINENTVLIGHSTGTGFLLRYLCENKVRVESLILLAPYLDPFKEESTDFFEFDFDGELLSRIGNVHILYSKDDSKSVLESTQIIRNYYPTMHVVEFQDKEHFTEEDLNSKEFPELLELLELF